MKKETKNLLIAGILTGLSALAGTIAAVMKRRR